MIFLLCIFIVAFLFSACGLGGASGFLAVMGLFNIEPELMKFVKCKLHLQNIVIHPSDTLHNGSCKMVNKSPIVAKIVARCSRNFENLNVDAEPLTRNTINNQCLKHSL